LEVPVGPDGPDVEASCDCDADISDMVSSSNEVEVSGWVRSTRDVNEVDSVLLAWLSTSASPSSTTMSSVSVTWIASPRPATLSGALRVGLWPVRRTRIDSVDWLVDPDVPCDPDACDISDMVSSSAEVEVSGCVRSTRDVKVDSGSVASSVYDSDISELPSPRCMRELLRICLAVTSLGLRWQ